MDAPIHRIRAARWFEHARDRHELVRLLESRARALECAHDARAPFARAYLMHAAAVRELLDTDALDGAAAWAERLLLELAHEYLRALDSWDRGYRSMTPTPWRAVFSASHTASCDASRLLDASLATHLAYDLPLVLGRTRTDDVLPSHAAAFIVLTHTLGEQARAVAHSIARRAAGPSTGLLALTARSDAVHEPELRRAAWDFGTALAAADDDRTRSAVFARIERDAVEAVRRILAPRAGRTAP